MRVLSRLLSRFSKTIERAPSSEAALASSGADSFAYRTDNPVVRAFLGGRPQEGSRPEPAKVSVPNRVPPSLLGSVLNEDEARLIHERWRLKGAYTVESTGKIRMTRRYTWWRQRVEALLAIPPQGLRERVGEWRRWLGQYEAHALWRLRLQGEVLWNPEALPAELAVQRFDGEPLGEPPSAVFRSVLLYNVRLPEGSQYAFRDDPMQLDDRFLVQENGVIKAGMRICGRADVEELFTSAGISDATERKVMKKVSEVHGGFETINTCGPGFVSVGFVPFTAGEAGDGSLAQLLRSMKASSPTEFEACFRRLGIDVDKLGLLAVHPESGRLLRGREAVSAIVDDKRLTALFYNAGKRSRAYQVAQLRLARELYYLASQDFTIKALARAGDKAILISISGKYCDVLRSEVGKAAIMDRAVQQGTENARQTFKEACLTVLEKKGISTVELLALYEALITPVLQSPGNERVRVLEDKELSRPAELPLL